jgi:hypothetical protein
MVVAAADPTLLRGLLTGFLTKTAQGNQMVEIDGEQP